MVSHHVIGHWCQTWLLFDLSSFFLSLEPGSYLQDSLPKVQSWSSETLHSPLNPNTLLFKLVTYIPFDLMPSSASRRGEIFLHRGDLTQARLWYEQAVTEARGGGPLKALSDALGNLGNVCALLEDHTQAEACYREVLEIQRTLQEGDAIGETLVNLGNLKTDTGQPEKARAYYLEALDTLTPLENDRALGILYSNLALQEIPHVLVFGAPTFYPQ